MKTSLVLASASPSRLELLRSAGIDPVVQPSAVDEDAVLSALPAAIAPADAVLELAKAKAVDVATTHAAALARRTGAERLIVVGCDSMLLAGDELVGKPLTAERAWQRWQALRGAAATLVTGHSVLDVVPAADGTQSSATIAQAVHDTSQTVVHFGSPADADIRAYIETGEPLEVAGAFTLESLGGWFIDRIEGDPSGVVGLSLPLLRRLLEQMNVLVSQLWRDDPTKVQPAAPQ